MIQLQNVCKTYHNQNNEKKVLNGVDFQQDDCGITMILGQSGCGKTTLLNIISGLEQDYEGEVHVEGTCAYIKQEIQLMESMSIYDNLSIKNNDASQIETLLKQFHLWEERTKKVKKLSTGQKKRVQVLREILLRPDTLLCDEPTAALDHENAEMLMELLKELSKEIPVIVVTHEIAIAKQYGDRICKIENGCIVKDEVLHKINQIQETSQKPMGSSRVSNLQLLKLCITSRPWESIFHIVFLFVLVVAIYVGGTFYASANSTQKQKEIWNNSENLLITQPNEDNYYLTEYDKEHQYFELREKEEGTIAFYYDTYSPVDITTVMEESQDVIGYRAGWDPFLYSIFPMYLPVRSKEEAERQIAYYETQGYGNLWSVDKLKKDLSDPTKTGYYDYFHVRGFYPDLNWIMYILNNSEKQLDTLYMDQTGDIPIKQSVVVYQIKEAYDLPIVYGEQMNDENEIVLPYDLAKSICMKRYAHEDVSQLLGEDIYLLLKNRNRSGQDSFELQDEKPMKIVGITSMENAQEVRIYMKAGAYDSYCFQTYQMNEKELEYQFVYFLGDPMSDQTEIAETINSLLPGEHSSFLPYEYTKSGHTTEKLYKSPVLFIGFALIIVACTLLILLLYELILFKRKRKEEELLKNAQYDLRKLYLMESICYMIPTMIILPLGLPFVIDRINALVRTYEYSDMITYSITSIVLSIVLGWMLYLLIRGGFYAMRIKKH